MIRTPLLVLAAFAALGLASTSAMAQNLAHKQIHARKVSPSQLSHYWIRTNTYVDADVLNGGQGLDKIGCAAVSYVIGSDGQTRHVKVQKVVPSTSDFQLTASSMIKAFHYAPAETNPHDVPVATYFIVPFNIPQGDRDTLQRVLKSCHLSGYGH